MIHATFQNLVNGLKVLTDISILAIDFCVKVHSCWRLLPQEPRHTKIEGIFCAIFFLRIKTDENMVHFWHFLCYISVITFFNSRFQPSIFFFFQKNLTRTFLYLPINHFMRKKNKTIVFVFLSWIFFLYITLVSTKLCCLFIPVSWAENALLPDTH